MPLYLHRCECGQTLERIAPMRDAGARVVCGVCRREMHRDYRGEQPRAVAYSPYEACSGGAAAWEMRDAFKRGKNWYRKDAKGRLRQLNPPGFDLNPKTGDVKIRNPQERLRYMRETGYKECRE